MENQETKEKDVENQEKLDNNNPMNTPEKRISIQEYHHARHALYFLYFGTYSVISKKPAWCTQEKIERILVHLNCLKEFIAADTILENAVNALLCRLNQSKPCNHKEWGHFLFHHWTWIYQLAAHYGEDKKCFPDSYFHALLKIVEKNG